MSVNKTVILVTAGILAFVAIFVLAFNKKEKPSYTPTSNAEVEITQTWRLPKLLNEISGMSYIGNQKLACIQDEKGQIFIYDLAGSKITKRITFGDSGDYEGIAVKNETAYVLRSDGTIFEVKNYLQEPEITEYETPLKSKNDIEGLFYDKKNNRLLLALKGKSFKNDDFKGVYAFDLEKKQFLKDPVLKLKFEGEVMEDVADEDVEERFYPSEILQMNSGEILLLEAKSPQLLILTSSGKPEKLYDLDKDDFPQPEGLALDEEGKLYISNEGNPATIHLVKLK